MKCAGCGREIGCQSKPKAPMVIVQNVLYCADCAPYPRAPEWARTWRAQKGAPGGDR